MDEDRKLGLLAAGLAMLASRGNAAQALGQGGLLGVQTMRAAQQDRRRDELASTENDYKKLMMEQQRAQMARDQQTQAGFDAARNAATVPPMGPPTADGQMQPGGFDPQKYLNAAMPFLPPQMLLGMAPKPQGPEEFGTKLETVNGPNGPRVVQVGKAGTIRDVPGATPYEKPGDQWEDVGKTADGQIIQRNKIDNQLRAVGSPAQRTTVNLPPAESEFDRTIGKQRAEMYVGFQKSGQAASAKLNALNAIESLAGDIETSSLTPAGMKAAGAAKALGIDIDPNLSRKQAADTIANKMALDARATGDGGGMPGAMSDQDREFLRNMNPNLSQTREGRKLIVDVQRRLAKREQQVADLARRYHSKNKRFDEGFSDELAQWSSANPLFADLQIAAPAPAGGGREVDFNDLKRRGR
jgi:hypothetical protein